MNKPNKVQTGLGLTIMTTGMGNYSKSSVHFWPLPWPAKLHGQASISNTHRLANGRWTTIWTLTVQIVLVDKNKMAPKCRCIKIHQHLHPLGKQNSQLSSSFLLLSSDNSRQKQQRLTSWSVGQLVKHDGQRMTQIGYIEQRERERHDTSNWTNVINWIVGARTEY